MDRAELADFLRHRREALQPGDVGLPAGARRRTRGLRREEVAALAAMSADYYTRLEQQRGPQPSEQMLASLARALRLTSGERDYLFQMAGHNPPASVSAATHVAPALLRVLDRLADTPALILSSLGETLVHNRMASALFGDNSGVHGPRPQRYLPLVHRPLGAAALSRGRPRPTEPRPGREPACGLRVDGRAVAGG
ncbi:MAG: helix-turn-helix domain-containing protein [Streptosporangiaceae bacterium]